MVGRTLKQMGLQEDNRVTKRSESQDFDEGRNSALVAFADSMIEQKHINPN